MVKNQWDVFEPCPSLREPRNLLLALCTRPQCDMPACGRPPAGSALQLAPLIGRNPAPSHPPFPRSPVSPQGRGLSMGDHVDMASLCGLDVYLGHRPPPLFPPLLSFLLQQEITSITSLVVFPSPPLSHLLSFRGLVSLNIQKPKTQTALRIALSLPPIQVTG